MLPVADVARTWFSDAICKAKSTSSWKELVGLQQLIEAKDAFGIERTLGSLVFSSGGFSSVNEYAVFVQNQAVANESLNSAISYAQLVHRMYYKYIDESVELITKIRAMRNEIRSYNMFSRNLLLGEPSAEKAVWWFGNVTMYTDLLFKIERNVKEYIMLEINTTYWFDTVRLVFLAVIIACTFPLSLLLLRTMLHQCEYKDNLEGADIEMSGMSTEQDEHNLNITERAMPIMLKSALSDAVAPVVISVVVAEFFDVPTDDMDVPVDEVVEVIDAIEACIQDVVACHGGFEQNMFGCATTVISKVNDKLAVQHATNVANFSVDLVESTRALTFATGNKIDVKVNIDIGNVAVGFPDQESDFGKLCFLGEPLASAMDMTIDNEKQEGEIRISRNCFNLLCYSLDFFTHIRRKEDNIDKSWGPSHLLLPEEQITYLIDSPASSSVTPEPVVDEINDICALINVDSDDDMNDVSDRVTTVDDALQHSANQMTDR